MFGARLPAPDFLGPDRLDRASFSAAHLACREDCQPSWARDRGRPAERLLHRLGLPNSNRLIMAQHVVNMGSLSSFCAHKNNDGRPVRLR